MLSLAMIFNLLFLNVRGKNSPSLLYWYIIRFAMSLVSSRKLLHEKRYTSAEIKAINWPFRVTWTI